MVTVDMIFINKYIAFVIWMNEVPPPMSTAGDGVVPFIYYVSLSLYLNFSHRTKSITPVVCSYLADSR